MRPAQVARPRRGRASQFARLSVERLEDRVTPAGNLRLTQAVLVDGNHAPQATPVIGQMVALRIDWTTSELAGGEQYIVRADMDGVPLDSATQTGQTGAGLGYTLFPGGWYSSPGSHSVTVTLDPANAMAESNETDNTLKFTYIPAPPTDLPARFQLPLAGIPNKDWAVDNYADVDPRAGTAADYRGGSFQYDGRIGVDLRAATFSAMDAGFAVLAAAAGTVVAVQDGNFDRVTTSSDVPANYVLVDHGNNWRTLYAGLARDSITVRVGDAVKSGQVLGLLGSSGPNTGSVATPHLHFVPYYRDTPIEMGYAPLTYEAVPLPAVPSLFGLDGPGFAIGAGITSENAGPGTLFKDFFEAPATVTTFDPTSSSRFYFWIVGYRVYRAGYRLYRPDGTLAFDSQASFSINHFQGIYWQLPVSTFQGSPGTWQASLVLGEGIPAIEEEHRFSFTVAPGASIPAIRVGDPDGKIALNGRTTPYEFPSSAVDGQSPKMTFAISNLGGGPLVLSNPVLPPGFSLVGDLPTTIPAYSSATVTVQLDTAVPGAKFGSFRFDTNDPDTPTYRYNLSGVVTGAPSAGAPVLALPDPGLAYNFPSLPRVLAPNALLADADTTHFAGGRLVVEIAAGDTASDRLGVFSQGSGPGQVGLSGTTLTFGGAPIGMHSGGTSGQPLTTVFTAGASSAAVQALLRSVTYSNSAITPEAPRRYVRFTLTDDTGLVSNMAIQNVSPSGVRSVPRVATPPTRSVMLGTPLTQGGSFTDAYGGSWTATVDYGDGTGPRPLALNPDQTFTLNHAYAAAGAYTATVTITNDIGGVGTQTMAVTVDAAVGVAGVQVNSGVQQRSMVTSVQVTFNSVVSLGPGAFTLTYIGAPNAGSTGGAFGSTVGGFSVSTATVNGVTVATLSGFTGTDTLRGSLIDGRYKLKVTAGAVTSGGVAMASDFIFADNDAIVGNQLYRLYGDANGDRVVNGADLSLFVQQFGGPSAAFDFNADGVLNGADVAEFVKRFGMGV